MPAPSTATPSSIQTVFEPPPAGFGTRIDSGASGGAERARGATEEAAGRSDFTGAGAGNDVFFASTAGGRELIFGWGAMDGTFGATTTGFTGSGSGAATTGAAPAV